MEKKEVLFAGAHNPLYLIRNSSQTSGPFPEKEASLINNGSTLYEFKGDRQPIGFHPEESKFTNHRISLLEQDTIYIFTDGFIDQFGGEQRKKFKSSRFKELLLSLQKESMDKQKQLLGQAFESWRGENEQIDDVCIVGFRI
jgi:serine phosphatase RsbU (regulator of sigma subunit)